MSSGRISGWPEPAEVGELIQQEQHLSPAFLAGDRRDGLPHDQPERRAVRGNPLLREGQIETDLSALQVRERHIRAAHRIGEEAAGLVDVEHLDGPGAEVRELLRVLLHLYGEIIADIGEQSAERRRGAHRLGEAAFASIEECEGAGLTDPHGLYLGLLSGEPLFYSGKAHLLTCAPARQGKGIGVVIPNLLHYSGSVVVTDPKGELAAVTADHRRERLGQTVVVLNPWGLHGLPQHRINPLEGLIALAGDAQGQRGLTDEVKAIALQLYPEPEDAKNRYWRDGSRSILRAVLLYLALCAPARCTLPEVWRIVANAKRLERTADPLRVPVASPRPWLLQGNEPVAEPSNRIAG